MADSGQQPFEVTDFSGGITDDLFEQDYTKYARLDNYNITSDKKVTSRFGSVIDDEDNGQIPGGVQRIGTLINYANSSTLLVQSAEAVYFRDPSAYATITGPTGNDAIPGGAVTDAVSYGLWNRHVYLTTDAFPSGMKIYRDDAGDFQVRSSGLPALATDPVVTAGAVGTRTYLYAFHYEYTYMVDDQEFQDLGHVTFVTLENSNDPSAFTNAISAIPVISNGSIDNWDTSVIRVFIYRSIDGGDTLYKIGEVTNGTTTFNDNFSDTSIQTGDILYTDDGTLDFDPTPKAKFVHVVNSTGYYGFISDGSEEFPYTIRQSTPGKPDACPADFEALVEDEVTGIYSVKSIPLVFCKRHIYRLEGFFDQFGRGGINPIRISDTAGCVSHLSIVQAENYTFWAGNDGFYATDGYQVIKISDQFNSLYQTILEAQSQTNRIYAKFDEKERRVLWGVQFDGASLDNDTCIILDLRWGVKPDSTFFTYSGGENFRPTALEFFNRLLYRGDTRGYVFKHTPAASTDPKVDTTAPVDEWSKATIIWTYQSININFGSTFFRKMPTRILLTASNAGNTTIQISAINDDGRSERDLKVIRWRKNFTWGDPEFVWGNPDCVWRGVGLIEQWRRFPAKPLRLSYLQLIITNGFSNIAISDTDGTATFDGTLKTATLDILTNTWPENCDGYFISTEVDGYSREFEIDTRNSDTVITVLDPDSFFPTGSFKWEIKGFKKGEPLALLSYNVHWNPVSQSQSTFEVGDDGNNS